MAVQITCSECGWRSSPCRSQTQADYALRRHSCAKELARQASARRGRARKAAVDRTPKPCGHNRANHQHGTHACYVLDKCRCEPCAAANAAYERRRARNRAYGRTPYVDAEPTRAHVRELMAAGIGLKRIGTLSGISHGVLWKLLYGCPRADGTTRPPARRVRWETAVRLQAVRATFDTLAGGARVDPTGTRRRIHALVAVGWSMSKLCECLGMHRGNFNKTLAAETVTARTARAVRALYDELWDQLPPRAEWRDKIAYSRSVNLAKTRGWAPPMAWDDIDTDPEPCHATAEGEYLDEVLVERLMAGRARIASTIGGPNGGGTPPELTEAIRRLHDRGLTDAEIGERVGRHRDAIAKIRHRAAERAQREQERAETDRTIDVIAGWATRSEDVASDLLEDAVSA